MNDFGLGGFSDNLDSSSLPTEDEFFGVAAPQPATALAQSQYDLPAQPQYDPSALPTEDEFFGPAQPPQEYSFLDDAILAGKAIGSGAYSAVADVLPKTVAEVKRGGDMSLHPDDWASQTINENTADLKAREFSPEEANREILGAKAKDIQGGISNLGYSAGAMLAGYGAHAAAGAAIGSAAGPAGTVAGTVAGMIGAGAAGLATGYRAAGDQFVEDIRKRVLAADPNLTEEKWEEIKQAISGDKQLYSWWEAGPEAAGEALTMGLIKTPVGKLFKEIPFIKNGVARAAAGAAAKIGLDIPVQVGSEVAAQMGQTAVAEPYTGEKAQNFGEALADVGPQTVVTTLATLGLGGLAERYTPSNINAREATQAIYDLVGDNQHRILNDTELATAEQAAGYLLKEHPSIEARDSLQMIQAEREARATQVQQNPVQPEATIEPAPAPQAMAEAQAVQQQARVGLGPFDAREENIFAGQELPQAQQPTPAFVSLGENMDWMEEPFPGSSPVAQHIAQGGSVNLLSGKPTGYGLGALVESEQAATEAAFPAVQQPAPQPAAPVGVYEQALPVMPQAPQVLPRANFAPAIRPVDAAAHEAAASPLNDLPQPTDAQKQAGNYRKGHVRVQGLDVSIENPAGSVRSGTAPDGTTWETPMQNHYGYIKGVVGKDKDHLDIFLSPGAESAEKAYVVNQIDPKTGKFDEHKGVVGPASLKEALDTYNSNYEAGWTGAHSVSEMPMTDFKVWLNKGSKRVPAPKGVKVADSRNTKVQEKPNEVKPGQEKVGPNYQRPDTQEVAPVFYSQMQRVLEKPGMLPKITTANSMLGAINKHVGKFKGVELEESGLKDWLSGLGGKMVTRQDVLDEVAGRQIKLGEVGKSGIPVGNPQFLATQDLPDATKYGQYQVPGGENYKETLMTLPKQDASARDKAARAVEEAQNRYEQDSSSANYSALVAARNAAKEVDANWVSNDYRSSHWGEPNVLAHLRTNERTDADGKKTLFVEEIQSDWHQAGKKKGYQGSTDGWTAERIPMEGIAEHNRPWRVLDKGGAVVYPELNPSMSREDALSFASRQKNRDSVPDAPFKNTSSWSLLAMKRAIRQAVEGGMDRVAWTPGEVQAERYDLAKQVDSVEYKRERDGSYRITANKSGRQVIGKGAISESDLPGVVGKELAQKIVSSPEPSGEFSGLDLKVGGEGMKGFYDQILPKEVAKYIKQFGGKVGETTINADDKALFEVLRDSVEENLEGEEYDNAQEALSRIEGSMGEYGLDGAISMESKHGDKDTAGLLESTLGHIRENLEDYDIPGQKVWSFDITPEMKKAAMEGQPLYKKGDSKEAPAGVDAALAKDVAVKLGVSTESMVVGPKLEIAPRELLAQMKIDKAMDTGGAYYRGKSYIFTDNHEDLNYTGRAILHEAFHEGVVKGVERMAKKLGLEPARDRIRATLQTIYSTNAREVQRNSVRRKYGHDFSKVSDRLQATEEWLAMNAETVKPKLMDRYIAAVRAFIRAVGQKLGIKGLDLNWSEAETRNFIRGALEAQRSSIEVGDSGPMYQTAYHGSGVKFDKFDTNKIGTGEGQSPYGYGFHFDDLKKSAEFYRKGVSAQLAKSREFFMVGDKKVPTGKNAYTITDNFSDNEVLMDAMYSANHERINSEYGDGGTDVNSMQKAHHGFIQAVDGGLDISNLVSSTTKYLKDGGVIFHPWAIFRGKTGPGYKYSRGVDSGDINSGVLNILGKLSGGPVTVQTQAPASGDSKGQVYKVNIPGKETLLDWETPFSEQPESVREALSSSGKAPANENTNGEGVYRALEKEFGSPKKASEFLASIGIPGHRYPSDESDGKYSYVIYDANPIEIKRTYYQRPDSREEQLAQARERLAKALKGTIIRAEDGIAADPAKLPMSKESVTAWLQRQYQDYVDQYAPVLREAGKLSKEAKAALQNQISFLRGGGGAVDEILTGKGEIRNYAAADPSETVPGSKSLAAVLEPIKGDPQMAEAFDLLLKGERQIALAKYRPEVARRDYLADRKYWLDALKEAQNAQERKLIRDQLKAIKEAFARQVKGVDATYWTQRIPEVETTLGPEKTAKVRLAMKDYRAFLGHAVLDRLHEAGVLSKEAYAKIKNAPEHEWYAPMQRQMDQIDQAQAQFVGHRDVIQRLKGSLRNTLPAVESAIAYVDRSVRLVAQNNVAKAFLAVREAKPDLTALIREVQVDPARVSGDRYIRVIEDGKKKFYEAPKEFVQALNGITPQEANLFKQIMAIPAKALRFGATMSLEFPVRNFFRDQWSAMINSNYGYTPFAGALDGMRRIAMNDKTVAEWKAAGGDQAYFTSLDRTVKHVQAKELMGLQEKGLVRYFKNPKELAGAIADGLRSVSDFAEKGTRVGLYANARKKGATAGEAATEARMSTLDFGRMGLSGRAVNSMIAFWNANVQDVDILARNLRDKPGRTLAKIALGVTLPSVLLWAAQHDDDRYKSTPKWLKDTFWVIYPWWDKEVKIPMILPKPFLMGALFGSSVEHMLDYAVDKKRDGLKDAMRGVAAVGVPGFMPTIASPILEWWTNYSFFRGRPLESQSDQKLPPSMRSNTQTQEIYKKLGNLIDVSPIKLENTVRGYTGNLGLATTAAMSAGIKAIDGKERPTEVAKRLTEQPGIKAVFGREPIGSNSQQVADFYDNLERSSQAEAGFKVLAGSGDKAAMVKFRDENRADITMSDALQETAKELSEIRKSIAATQKHPTMAPEMKRQRMDQLNRTMTKVAGQANAIHEKRKAGK